MYADTAESAAQTVKKKNQSLNSAQGAAQRSADRAETAATQAGTGVTTATTATLAAATSCESAATHKTKVSSMLDECRTIDAGDCSTEFDVASDGPTSTHLNTQAATIRDNLDRLQ